MNEPDIRFEYCLKKATQEDIPLIRKMAAVAFPHTYGQILSPEQIDYMMDMMYSEENLHRQMTQEQNTFFICDEKGYVSIRPDGITPDGKSLFHLEKLYVVPQWQGKGLGESLFERALCFARESSHGTAVVELNVNRHNRAFDFYVRHGMKVIRQVDNPIGNGYYMNDFIMSLELVR